MKYLLNDGKYAHLKSIIQTSEHLRDYLDLPKDSVEEIKRIAQAHLTPNCWRKAPLVFIGYESEDLKELMRTKKLPPILCIGEFVSYRMRDEQSANASFLYVVWLQDEFEPHMSDGNQELFKRLDWESVSSSPHFK
jgi:hypothetical protein